MPLCNSNLAVLGLQNATPTLKPNQSGKNTNKAITIRLIVDVAQPVQQMNFMQQKLVTGMWNHLISMKRGYGYLAHSKLCHLHFSFCGVSDGRLHLSTKEYITQSPRVERAAQQKVSHVQQVLLPPYSFCCGLCISTLFASRSSAQSLSDPCLFAHVSAQFKDVCIRLHTTGCIDAAKMQNI